jgi:hypothetical protein
MEFMLGCALILLIIILINIGSIKSKQKKNCKELEILQDYISNLERTFSLLLKTRAKTTVQDTTPAKEEHVATASTDEIKIHPAYATRTPEQITQKQAAVSSVNFEKTENRKTVEETAVKPSFDVQSEQKVITPTEPLIPREPSAFEQKVTEINDRATEILQKAWSWVVVGEEFRNPKFSMEYAVASAWLLRAAIIILLLGGVFMANYSIEKGILGPIPRVIGILLMGVVLLVAGIKLAYTKYHPISQGLLGGGIAFLYIGIFTGFAQYHLFTYLIAFGLMLIVTAVAGYISVRLNSMLTAIFGVIGGYVTPLLVNSGDVNLTAFYSYMLILTICILAIAKFKDWKILNALAFIFTYALFFYSLKSTGDYNAATWTTIQTFFAVFFILFSLIPIIYNIFNRIEATYIELIFMFLNVSIFFCKAYDLIVNNFDRQYASILTISLTIFFILQIYIFLKKNIIDKKLLVFFAGTAAFFLIFTIPVLLSGKLITAAWALMALIFIWMSRKLKCNILRMIGYILYGLTIVRLVSYDFYDNFLSDGSFNNYWKYMLGRILTFGTTVASFACSSYILKKEKIESNKEYANVLEQNNIIGTKDINGVIKILFWMIFVSIFVYLQLEIYHICEHAITNLELPLIALVWIATFYYLIKKSCDFKKPVFLCVLFGLSCIFLIKLASVDLLFWDFSYIKFVFDEPYSFVSASYRLLDFIPIILAFAYFSMITKNINDSNIERFVNYKYFMTCSLAILFCYTTFELNSMLLYKVPGFQYGGISILWCTFAITFLIYGILKNGKTLRTISLILFAVTIAKVFIFDLRELSQIYKIVAFIILGLIILIAAFAYVKYKENFEIEDES